jgi:hypothetical protein
MATPQIAGYSEHTHVSALEGIDEPGFAFRSLTMTGEKI